MNTKVEKIDDKMCKVIVEVENEVFLKSENEVFLKKKSKFNIPGFRKGHATKDMIFKIYGREALFDDTVDECIKKTYYDAIKNCGEKVISRPKISIKEIGADKNFIYEATVAIIPDIEIKDYKGIQIKAEKLEVTDEEIENRLKSEQEKNARFVPVDRESKDLDVVNINFEGFVNGVPFKGGKGENYDLTLGSHTFIDNFEEQLMNHKVGDEVKVNVKFPDNYGEKTLEGKNAVFNVKINSIKEKELPEINDEFASEVSEFEKLDDYKASIKEELLANKKAENKIVEQNNMLDTLLEKNPFEIAKEAEDFAVDESIEDLNKRLYSQGIRMEDYIKYLNITMDELRERQSAGAIKKFKVSILLEKIGEKENIKASDEKVNERISNMAKSYGMKEEDFISSYINDEEKESIREDLLYPTVVDYLYDNAKIE